MSEHAGRRPPAAPLLCPPSRSVGLPPHAALTATAALQIGAPQVCAAGSPGPARRLYLAQAEIEADRNRWVSSLLAICGSSGGTPSPCPATAARPANERLLLLLLLLLLLAACQYFPQHSSARQASGPADPLPHKLRATPSCPHTWACSQRYRTWPARRPQQPRSRSPARPRRRSWCPRQAGLPAAAPACRIWRCRCMLAPCRLLPAGRCFSASMLQLHAVHLWLQQPLNSTLRVWRCRWSWQQSAPPREQRWRRAATPMPSRPRKW